MQRPARSTPRDRRIWTGGAQGIGAEYFVPGDVERLLAEGQRCSVSVHGASEIDGLTDFQNRPLTGLQLHVTPLHGGEYRADVALYVPPDIDDVYETPGLPGRVSASNRYCVVVDWDAAIARVRGIDPQ